MPLQMVNPTDAPEIRPRTWATAVSTYLPLNGRGVDDGLHWLGGISFPPHGCTRLTGFPTDDPCATETAAPDSAANLTYADAADCVTFLPFRIEVFLEYQMLNGTTAEQAEAYVRSHAELARSYILAREVLNSALVPANPSLVDQADTVTGLNSTPAGALGAVEDGLASRLANGLGMIHVTPGLLTILQAGGGLHFDGTNYRTPTGHLVVADAGYTGGAPGTGTVTPAQPWIYGSGDVSYRHSGQEATGAPWELFEYKRNKVTLNVEEYGIFKFEPCSVVASRVLVA